jgi:uncharacterized protein
LISGNNMKPTSSGNIIYLVVGDLDAALSRTQKAGGSIALQKTALPGDMGCYAHIIDSEGNRIGLHTRNH